MTIDEDFYKVRPRIKPERYAPDPVGWNPERTYTGNPPRFGEDEDAWDSSPSRLPYPARMPDLHGSPSPAANGPDIHVTALHVTQRQVHEDAIMVDGGERRRLPNLKRGIQEILALSQELGTNLVTLSDQSQAYLDDTDYGDTTGRDIR